MRGIVMQGPNVIAIDVGRKTQTRRIAKLPNQPTFRGDWEADTIGGPGTFTPKGELLPEQPVIWNPTTGMVIACPYGVVGDRLWVRESVRRSTTINPRTGGRDFAEYAADGAECHFLDTWPWKNNSLSPIHMPFGLRRLEIELVAVRIERLNEISELDARREGVTPFKHDPEGDVWTARDDLHRAAYEFLWNELHGWNPNAWALNPWVWVLTFVAHKRDA